MLLSHIWLASLILAAASLGTMGVLIVRRMVIDHLSRLRKARQKALRSLVFEYLENPGEGDDLLDHLTEDDRRDIRDKVEDLVRMVRGTARDKLLQMVNELGGWETFCEVLESGSDNRRSRAGAIPVDWFLPRGWGNEDHRLRAVAALKLFDDPRATEALKVGLSDRSPRVRLAAAQALVDAGAEESVGALVERLDIGDEIRSRAVREIFRALAPRRTLEMLDLLTTDASETVKVLALYGLAGTRDPALLPAVAAQASSPSVDVRAESMRALATISHPGVAPTVIAGLADVSWVVRAQAAICAGTIGLAEAVPALIALLGDGEWWVRFRAARALNQIGGEGRHALERTAAEAGPAQDIAVAVLAEAEAA
jgi:HEAT repeat protein